MIDLTDYVPSQARFVAADDKDYFHLCSSYTKHFTLRRAPAEALIMWLIGFYLAEGSKQGGAKRHAPNEWTLGQKSVYILAAVISALHELGIDNERLALYVRHGPEVDVETARRFYEPLCIRITHVVPFTVGRGRNGQSIIGKHAGILRIEGSLNIARLFLRIIHDVVQGDLLDKISINGARAFAFGYWDGDGSVTNARTSLRLGVSDQNHANLRACDRALQRVYNWFPAEINGNELTRYIDGRAAARLVLDGAFRFSMARARLLLFAADHAPQATVDKLKPELQLLTEHVLPETRGVVDERCVPYPLIEDPKTASIVPFCITPTEGNPDD